MNKREYYKYNYQANDMLGNELYIGDTVVVNNYYRNIPNIGTLDHYTKSGKCAIKIVYHRDQNNNEFYWNAYRHPNTIIQIKK